MSFIYRSEFLACPHSLWQSLNLYGQTMLTLIITIISSILLFWNGQMNSRYSIKWSLKTSLISARLKEFLWSGNCVPMWLTHGWLQAKILSIFQDAFSALYCFWATRRWSNPGLRRMCMSFSSSLGVWFLFFCRCWQEVSHPDRENNKNLFKKVLRIESSAVWLISLLTYLALPKKQSVCRQRDWHIYVCMYILYVYIERKRGDVITMFKDHYIQ